MTEEQIKAHIAELRNDEDYYGELGRRFLSNSDIVTLIRRPDRYGVGLDDSINLIKGNYMHKRILQPELIKDFVVIDSDTRRNKEYTSFVAEHAVDGQPKPTFLLRHEAMELEALAKKIEGNVEFVDALQAQIEPYEIEEPALGQIEGYWFKGKADRINKRRGFIADLKTTGNLDSFRSSVRDFGYHSQAYIYQQLFGLPVRFYVIDKTDGRLAIVDLSPETLEEGRRYVCWGLEKLEMYYGERPTESLDQYYEYLYI